MKNMALKTDPAHFEQINAHLDEMNIAPFFTIGAIFLSLFCLFMVIFLTSVF